jgi:hypothetical protein
MWLFMLLFLKEESLEGLDFYAPPKKDFLLFKGEAGSSILSKYPDFLSSEEIN